MSTAAMMLTVPPIAARAASAGPGWAVASVAQPTNFSAGDNALCARVSLSFCDRYVVTVTNVGGGPTDSPVVIADTLPPGLQPLAMTVVSLETGTEAGCNVATTTCVYGEPVLPGNTLKVQLEVKVTGAEGPLVNAVTVSGGGATSVTTEAPLTMPNIIGGPQAAFGIAGFGFEVHDMNGRLDTQASDHAYGLTSTVNFNTAVIPSVNGIPVPASVESPKNLAVYLPLGFLGDPTAAGQCTALQLHHCPLDARVGTAVVFVENDVTGTVVPRSAGGGLVSAVYNMVPEHGYPAQFAFTYQGVAIPLYASLVHTPAGYALRVAVPGLPTTLHIEGAALTFFGDPQTADGNPSASQAFLTNPGDCSAGPLAARVQADSWPHPGQWVTAESVTYPRITGCNLLQFEPTIEMQPEVTQAEEPSGYRIGIKIPQNPPHFPVLATPQLKNVAVTLPEGMTISPGGGDGLTGCAATGPHGIDMPTGGSSTPTDVGAGAKGERGEEIGQDGMTHLVAGHCPQSSQIGTVEIRTPVLKSPLEGRVYLAQPRCGGAGRPECTSVDATNGNLFGLYLEAEGSGAVVKLAGSASVDPAIGRLTARFLENPQVPVSEVNVQLKGGARAPLANPRQCGAAVTSGDLAPWSSPITPDAIVASSFPVDWDGHNGACPATLPFAPTIGAGVTNPRAGGFSPFTFTLTRGDRQQDLARLQVKTPAGLLGMLSRVALCAELRAAQGTCEEASQIGTTWVAAGSGSHPLWVSGRVYLTGPYAGAPFGLSIVVPAVAGPFNLGNVVVRSRIDVDPRTAAITITSDPIPQILDGIPLRIQTVNVTIDKPQFMFNPTNCEAKQITATLASAQGTSAQVSSPFAAGGCKNLPFNPGFKVSTQAGTSKAMGASLDVKVTSGPGQANVGKTVVSLPKQLPARLTTLQKACTEQVFAANPATCPAASAVGTATVHTPVLNQPLTGPAYLVSHGGAAFPDLVVILQGQGVRLDLVGNTNIKHQITTSSFNAVPDAPITSFELKLPQGPHSALSSNLPAKAKGDFCGTKLIMPTTITGQNGRKLTRSTKITVTGCPKVKPKKRKRGK